MAGSAAVSGVSSPLRFVSAAELRRHTPDEPPWIWRGYLARGAVTIVAGKPKVGKSTLAFALADALTRRTPAFLGRELDGGPVVYVSEETVGTLAHKLPAADDLWVLPRDLAWPKPSWGELIDAAVVEARRVGAVALVIDTLAHWAAMPSHREKDAGSAQAVMERLQDAASKGVAVLLVMHQRKAGGEDGEGVRGSGAFAGAADIVVELERAQRPRERVLLTLSRYPSALGSLVVSHDATAGAWSVVGEGERGEARLIADRQAIIAALQSDGELTRAELEQALGSRQRQWAAPLRSLLEEGRVRRSGAGVKGKPYRFSLVRTDSAQPAAQHPRRNRAEPRSDDAAHPEGVQHERGELPKARSAPTAAADAGSDDPDATLRRVTEKFPELAQ
jgi:AAA domain